MLSQREYNKRIKENNVTFKNHYNSGKFDITEYHFFDATRGSITIPKLLINIHDIYGAAIVGALPTLSRSGTDAVFMKDGIEYPLEIKTTYFTKDSGEPSKIRSICRASYKHSGNWDTKYKNTNLICLDGDTGDLICAYKMYKDEVKMLLERSSSSFRGISLSKFIAHGKVIDTIIPQVGIDEWIGKQI